MTWQAAEMLIQTTIVPASAGILKCSGTDRRCIISNDGRVILMRTGAVAGRNKETTYGMIKTAFELLKVTGRFDSNDFRKAYPKKYADGQCRYSMTGGVLVEIGVAVRIVERKDRCHYEIKAQ